MNAHSLIPLLASIAYIPLFILLIANRPWQKQKVIFALFLAAAMLWSFSDFLFRSDYLVDEKLILAKIVLCIVSFAIAQLHYFLRSFYDKSKPGFPVAYLFTVLCFVIIVLFVPKDVNLENGVVPVYGFFIYPLACYYLALLGWDMFNLIRKLRAVMDPVVRNQIVYLVTGLIILVIFATLSLTPIGHDYPIAHLGNFINAVILTYAVVMYRLLDIRLVLRRGLTWVSMASIGIGVYLLAYVIGHFAFAIQVNQTNFMLGMGVCLAVAFVVYQARVFTANQINRLFYRDSYEYRHELDNFIQHKIKGIFSLDELGNELLSLLAGALRSEQAFLLLPADSTEDLSVRFAVPTQDKMPSLLIKGDSPIITWIKQNRSYLPKDKLYLLPEFKGLWIEERNNIELLNIELFVPVISRDKIIGLLALGEKQNKSRYTLEDINLSEKISNQVAASLEKEHLQDQLRKREQELSLINRLAGVISSSLNVQEVYDAFVKELQEVVEADFTAIATIEGNEIFFAALTTEVGSVWHAGQKIPLAGTAAEWIYTNKKPLYERDLTKNKRFWTGTEYAKRGIRSILFLPLMVKGEVIGCLVLGSRKPYAYNSEQITLLEHLSSQIAAPIDNSRLYTKAEEIARVDGLTDLFNRRHFDERLREEIDRHSRYGDMLTLLLLDLDNFKKYNDTFGHMAGDKQLALAACLIQSAIRSSDLAFRYGGDEFAIILPNSTTVEAFSVAERVRERISFEMASKQLDITVSIGLASWPGDGRTLDELCSAADTALYYAKRTGQNRTSIASKTMFSLTEPNVNASAETEVLSTIYALAATLEARDKYTYGHSRKVSRYAVAVAESLGLPPEQVTVISAAALLHDIGKIGIPDNILNKNGKLLDEEWELLKSHPRLSATIIGHIPSLSACLSAVRHHHERWDGNGYPAALQGEAIPIEARILAVTDAFEAMISDRPYRGPLSFKKAVSELENCAGTQFDPSVVRAFIPIVLATVPDETELEVYKSLQQSD